MTAVCVSVNLCSTTVHRAMYMFFIKCSLEPVKLMGIYPLRVLIKIKALFSRQLQVDITRAGA